MENDRIVDIAIIVAVLSIIGLKIAGIITWTWWQLIAPIVYLFGAGILLATILLIVGIFIINKKENENERY